MARDRAFSSLCICYIRFCQLIFLEVKIEINWVILTPCPVVSDRNSVSAPNFGRNYGYRYQRRNFFFRNRNFFFFFFKFFWIFFLYFCFLGEYKILKTSKVILKSWKFGSKFGLKGSFMIEKIPHTIFPLKCGFGIGYGIGRNYQPIWVSVSDRN